MSIKVDPTIFSPILSVLYGGWIRTMTVRVSGLEALRQATSTGRRLVYGVWHDEFFPLVSLRRRMPNENILVVVSQSRDGELISRILERWGFRTSRGSSTRGGVRALVSACRLMRDQDMDAVFLVDGPKGPRHVAKDGLFYLASKIDALIVPIAIVNSRAKIFTRSWDRFQLPLPFSVSEVIYGEPYAPEGELDETGLARERLKFEERLARLHAKPREGSRE